MAIESTPEILLVLAHQQREIDGIKAQLCRLLGTGDDWISPNQAAKNSCYKYSAHDFKRMIDLAIDHPLESKLVEGIHFIRSIGERDRRRYKINWGLVAQIV